MENVLWYDGEMMASTVVVGMSMEIVFYSNPLGVGWVGVERDKKLAVAWRVSIKKTRPKEMRNLRTENQSCFAVVD